MYRTLNEANAARGTLKPYGLPPISLKRVEPLTECDELYHRVLLIFCEERQFSEVTLNSFETMEIFFNRAIFEFIAERGKCHCVWISYFNSSMRCLVISSLF